MKRLQLGTAWMVGCVVLVGCGHTDDEMAAKQAEVDQANALVAQMSRQVDQERREVAKQEASIDELKGDLARDIEAQKAESATHESSSAEESAQDRLQRRLAAKKDECDCK